MSGDAERMIRRAYEAFNNRDADSAVGLMAPDVEWPDAAEGGFVHGREAVREHWREQFEAVDPRVEPLEIRQRSDGRIAVNVRQIVDSGDGSSSAERLVHLFTIRAGLIERMEIAGEASSDDQ